MKKILLIAIIISLLIPILTAAEKTYDDKDILVNIVNELGGQIQEVETSMNGVLLKEFLNKEELNILLNNILNMMDIIELDREEIYGNGYSQINLYSYDKYKNPITMIISSYYDEESKTDETYLYFNLINNEQFLTNNDIIDKVQVIFKDNNSFMDKTTSILAYIDGKAANNEIENKTNKALRKFKGQTVESFKDINLLSYTAYTPYIVRNIEIDKKKINLNLAIRYNDYEDKTLIWIGTPIITSGY